ncbi:putative RNA-dependent RNA polymerase [Starmerella bacillaris ormycovirus 1]|nr:putative RNA-dependent RNA polymerase [Starmerella bacillaris ormycovirus 1]
MTSFSLFDTLIAERLRPDDARIVHQVEKIRSWMHHDKSGMYPLLKGNNVPKRLTMEQESMWVAFCKYHFKGLSYREIKLSIKSFSSTCQDAILIQELTRVMVYFKIISDACKNRKLCTHIFRTCTSVEGQDLYDDFIIYMAEVNDDKASNRDIRQHPDPRIMDLWRRYWDSGRYTIDLPSKRGFPTFEIEKESKMYLTRLDPPNTQQQERFRKLAYESIKKMGPNSLPSIQSGYGYKLSTSKFNDDGVSKYDYERPTRFKGPFKYQKIYTAPGTVREVWLPSKAYKTNSSWWHEYAYAILQEYPYVVQNEDATDIAKRIGTRFRECKAVDLKGFGLQFPREYILILIEVINSLYPNEIGEENMQIAKTLFSEMCVDDYEGNVSLPRRGVGLGYYTSLMTLAVAIILQDVYVIMMFSDDILVDSTQYEKCCETLVEYGFILNEKKCGREWTSWPLFAGRTVVPGKYTLHYGTNNGPVAAVFNARYHWQRKQIISTLTSRWQLVFMFQYRHIFGHEFHKMESLLHVNDGGVGTLVHPLQGFTEKYPSGTKPFGDRDRVLIPYKKLKLDDARRIHYERKRVYRHHITRHTCIDAEVYGELEYKSKKPLSTNHITSMNWLDRISLEFHGEVPENLLQGLSQPYIRTHKRLAIGSNDPITAISHGGVIDTSGRYRWMPLSRENDILIDAYANLPVINNLWIQKISPKEFFDPQHEALRKMLETMDDHGDEELYDMIVKAAGERPTVTADDCVESDGFSEDDTYYSDIDLDL